MAELAPWQYVALNSPYEHFYFAGGVATGKTFTGSHFALKCIETQPDVTGFIGANTYDQLSQASLREFIYWLDEYGYDYVIDQRPPAIWGAPRQLKTYKNTISVRPKSKKRTTTLLFTRVLSKPNPVRGIEFGWYWIDESRDTPLETHDVVLSRMRESRTFRRGLVTSTTNGEDWAHKRFVKDCRKGQRLWGAMHIPTTASVEAGIVSKEYLDMLLSTYSPMMALQEIYAQHVNVRGGRAYYAFGNENRTPISPWGDTVPDRSRPLIVGCDFNFSPAPCVWVIGQQGTGEWAEHIHWYGEIAKVEASTPQMAIELIHQYPNFMYRIFGDSSGLRGTTSNAGQHDYHQIANTLTDANCLFTIDAEQVNPQVKDRIENMNRLAKNAVGEIRMTYNPYTCPLFDSDVKNVGWKPTVLMGRAKLDDGGDKTRTHATDGAGYAMWKLFPPGTRATMIEAVPSFISRAY